LASLGFFAPVNALRAADEPTAAESASDDEAPQGPALAAPDDETPEPADGAAGEVSSDDEVLPSLFPTPASLEVPVKAEPTPAEAADSPAPVLDSSDESEPLTPTPEPEPAATSPDESAETSEPTPATEPTPVSAPETAPAQKPNLPAKLDPPPQAKPVLGEPGATARGPKSSRRTTPVAKPAADTAPPAPAGRAAPATSLSPAAFNGVKPGETTESELLAAWGKPVEKHQVDAQTQYSFRIKPFSKVAATVVAEQVTSIAIHLGTAIEPAVIARQLDLDIDSAATVLDDAGLPLGLAFPERGVLFSYAPKPGQPRVLLVMLDPIDAQPFLVRAEGRLRQTPSAALADLEVALKLDPNYAHAWWVKARALLELGRSTDALTAATEALRLEPAAPQYRLTAAAAHAAIGEHAAALVAADSVLAVDKLEPLVRGAALKLRGDLAATGPGRNPQQALSFHTQAIKLVDPLGLDERPIVRRGAKELLFKLHLAVAADVAWGHWRDKPKVVPKWLERAAAFAEDLEQVESVELPLRLEMARGALAAAAGVQGRLNVARWLSRGQEEAQQLVAKTSDPARQAELRWQLALLLYDALQVEHARGNVAEADKYGEQVIAAVGAIDATWRPDAGDYLLGRTYFRLGAVHAVHKNEHQEAVTWYEQARPLLEKPNAGLPLADHAPRGEDFVSMGVSYWEANQRKLAVELTKQGIELLQAGAEEQLIEPKSLSVPYANLAAMLEAMGQREESQRFAELAAGSRETKTR
jgi:tetratricopeptide (TPR) repeat protein